MPFSVEKAIVLRYNKITNKKCKFFTKGYPFVFVTDNRNKRQLTEKIFQLEERIRRNGRLVEESFSFGLMLFAIGLCLTLGYLLLGFLRHS